MTGRVCPKHEEWCPTGVCRWCPPPEPPPALLPSIWDYVVPVGGPLPIPIIMHFPECAQTPCSCPAIAAARAGKP
jgi:hypothetical protein